LVHGEKKKDEREREGNMMRIEIPGSFFESRTVIRI